MNFIQDNERNFNEDDDFLDYDCYVSNLEKIIINSPDSSFTIGLFGGWGSGKSSIIKTVEDNLKNKHEEIKIINYDAWKYSDDSFRRTFLINIVNSPTYKNLFSDSESKISELNNKFYKNTIKDFSIKFKINKIFIILLALAIVCIIIAFLFKRCTNELTVFAIFSGACSIISSSGCSLKTVVNEPLMFAPEQFEECFKKLTDKILKTEKCEKIIFVIDNLDRCSDSEVLKRLKTIKNFLNHSNVIFLIPLDDYSFKKENSYKKLVIVNEFMRKIFDVSLKIKPMYNIEIKDYVLQIQKQHKCNFSQEILFSISNTFIKNPRQIIHFLNNLLVELNNYEKEFRKKYKTEICRFLIIREEYPHVYQKLSNNLQMVMNLDDLKMINFNDLEELEYKYEVKEFLNFNRRTADIYNTIQPTVVNKIFHKANQFNGISEEINNAIKLKDYDSLKKFIKKIDEDDKKSLSLYLYTAIEEHFNEKQFAVLIDRFNVLLSLYEDLNITEIPPFLEEILRKEKELIIEKVDNFQAFITYLKLSERELLIREIIKTFNEKINRLRDFHEPKTKNVNYASLRIMYKEFPEYYNKR